MKRQLVEQLIQWKNNKRRKPLILNGARQVGKTWLLKEFGKTHFEKVAYISLDSNEIAHALFENNLEIKRIIQELSLLTGVSIEPNSTLIIIDEIQAQPKAITALKYFCEEAPEYAVAAAGSLLGLSAHFGSGYPVGKVETLNLYPLSFEEFLEATSNGQLHDLVLHGEESSINLFAPRFEELLKQYYVVGGMPAVVEEFLSSSDFSAVRKLQNQILEDYSRDFAKHAPAQIYPKMLEVWASIPQHLSLENKKFVFGNVRKGSRAKTFEEAINWLYQAGLIHKVPRVTKPGLPLSAYADNKAFKVFLVDVGLLGAMTSLDPKTILEKNSIFTEFKGALTEQYVCQELIASCSLDPYYWSAETSTGEIDFIVQLSNRVYAIEVKAEENLKAKSLIAFKKANPEINAVRFSLSGYRKQDWMVNVPLYAISNTGLW